MKRQLQVATLVAPLLCSGAPLCHAAGPGFTRLFAVADSPETVFNNPAGMTRLDGTQMTGQTILAAPLQQFEVDEELTTVDGGNAREPAAAVVPGFYYSREMRENVHLGLSVNVPTGFGANSGPDWAGRYYNHEFTLVYVSFSPAIAYKLNDKWSLGAGVTAMYTSSTTSSQVNNDPFLSGAPDGKIKSESDGIGFGFSLSALYEFTDNTRFGVIYRSETEADLDTTLNFENVIRPPHVIDKLESQTIEVTDRVPAMIGGGVFHRFDNDWEFTADLLWIEFSKFGVTEIRLSEEDIQVPGGQFEDFYAGSVGLSWPINSKIRASVGALYVEQPMKDENRTLSFQLDEMFGLGAGIEYSLESVNDHHLSFNVINTGEAPVDTGHDPIHGRVAGKSEDHYAIAIDFSYNWR